MEPLTTSLVSTVRRQIDKMTSSTCWRNSQETVPRLVSPPEMMPAIVLSDDNLEEYDISYAKRQRRGHDGGYSPCPSQNSSAPHSPSSNPEENPASRVQHFPLSSLQPSPSPRPITIDSDSPELGSEAGGGESTLDDLMADLSIVFNNRALGDVDQELCFGMVWYVR